MWGWCTSENPRNTTAVPAADTSFYPVFTPRAYRARIVYGGRARRHPRSSFVGRSLVSQPFRAEVVGGFEVRGWYVDGNHSVEVEGGLFHHAWA